MVKDVEYYMNLPYKVETTALPPEDGGGFMMTMPELGSAAVLGDGETPNEAWKMLKEVQREVISLMLARGVDVPEPEALRHYSGKIALRISPQLHRNLSGNAKRAHTSLNQYISQALECYTTADWLISHTSNTTHA